MKNVADTETYTVFDHVLSKTVRSLSHVVGLRKITQPFWARWLASGIRPEVTSLRAGNSSVWYSIARR